MEDNTEHLRTESEVFEEGQEERLRSGSVLQKVDKSPEVRVEEGMNNQTLQSTVHQIINSRARKTACELSKEF